MSEIVPDLNPVNIPYTICEALIGIFAILGNGIVLIVLFSDKKLRTTSNCYIISLAFADFLLGLIGIPFAILIEIGLPRNLRFCLCAISTLVGVATISIFCLIAVSIDRYWAILHPLDYSEQSRKKWFLINNGLAWFLGLIVGFLPSFGWYNDEIEGRCIFAEKIEKSYFIFFCFMSIIIPTVILVILYGFIYTVIRKQITKRKENRIRAMTTNRNFNINPEANDEDAIRELEKRETSAAISLSVIVVFFVICWLPLNVCNMISWAAKDPHVGKTVLLVCIALSHANSAFNPFLYAYNLKDFRKTFLKIFCCKQMTPSSPQTTCT